MFLLVILLMFPGLIVGELYHIMPNLSSTCSSHSCFTLSEFAEILNSNKSMLRLNITLTFQPGYHHLNSSFMVESIQMLNLHGYAQLGDVKINCNSLENVLHFDIYNLTRAEMRGLEFYGCTSRFTNIDELLITSSIFSSCPRSALAISETFAEIVESLFSFNTGRDYQGSKGHSGSGGALVINTSNIMIIASTFDGNTAENGGAIFAERDSNVTIVNSTFEENTVECDASSYYSLCYGGVLYSENCTITILGSRFQNNSAKERGNPRMKLGSFHNVFSSNRIAEPGSHGGVFALFQSTISISHNVFLHNQAKRNGGVIRGYKCTITSKGNFFHQNSATAGGVMNALRSKIYDRESVFSENTVDDYGGVIYFIFGTSQFFASDLKSNNAGKNGGVFYMRKGKLFINQTKILDNFANRAGVIYGQADSSVHVHASEFTRNSARAGGCICLVDSIKLFLTGNNFTNNSILPTASNGGAVIYVRNSYPYSTVVTGILQENIFLNNFVRGDGSGGILNGDRMNCEFYSCTFATNTAGKKGGVIAVKKSHINFTLCEFYNNSALDGGVIYAESSHISILECAFKMNSASIGAVMSTSRKTTITFENVEIRSNTAKHAATLYLMESKAVFFGYMYVTENIGSVLIYNSAVNFTTLAQFINCSMPASTSILFQEGGAVTIFQSQVEIYGKCLFLQNSAKHGGAMHVSDSKINVYGELNVSLNRAEISGGGIFLYQSNLHCKSNSSVELFRNIGQEKGGGIHAVGSSISVNFHEINDVLTIIYHYIGTRLSFIENFSEKGAGLFLEYNANMYILKELTTVIFKTDPGITSLPTVCDIHAITFTDNRANYGAAIYVDDGTYFTICSTSESVLSTFSECFLQVQLLNNPIREQDCVSSYVSFVNNTADISGSSLYGGLLDRCTLSPFANIYKNTSPEDTSRVTYFSDIDDSEISSAPVRVCLCTDGKPNCSYNSLSIIVKKGETFYVPLVAVDHLHHVLSNVTIQSLLLSKSGGLGENQLSQVTKDACSDLRFEVYSRNNEEELVLYAEGPCKDALPSQRRVKIQFSPCTCAIGFQPNSAHLTRCECECDSKLDKYVSRCNPQTVSLTRKDNSWIAYINYSSANITEYQYLTYPNCPLDYCHSPNTLVMVNLNTENGSDMLCARNHSGKLCGSCQPGLSLSLGSSRCVACPTYWPVLTATITVATILGGVLLIAALMTLNITVATGTLNGIIFYANIINADTNTFLPFHGPNLITVFLAWLNLELGIDTCFFHGMDAFWKTLLQIIFPLYLITLVVLIIVISERYTWFARLFEKKDPVATLATVVLMSYVKLLHLIIATISFIVLTYPDRSIQIVWLPDANVVYMRGKHVVLLLIVVVVFFVGAGFTLLLFAWQWLIRSKYKMIHRLLQNKRFYMFFETFYAPYTSQHRYWTGLLLILRAVVYSVSAMNVTKNPETTVLAIALAVTGLLLLKGYSKRLVYRKWPVDVLEVLCYMNILVFCLAKLFTLAGHHDGRAIAYISGSVTMALFVTVFAYHTYVEVLSKAKSPLLKMLRKKEQLLCRDLESDVNLQTNYQHVLNQPTYSEVAGPTQNECQENFQEMSCQVK